MNLDDYSHASLETEEEGRRAREIHSMEEEAERVKGWPGLNGLLLSLKIEEGGSSQRRQWPLETGNSPQPTASKETGTPVPQPQGAKFCQQRQ